MKKYIMFATVFILLFSPCLVFAQKSSKGADEETKQIIKQFTDDMQSTYQNARELTNKGDEKLFLPDNKVGDATVAEYFYLRSNDLLGKFFNRWDYLYRQEPSLFALPDVLRVQNARGLAWVSLVYKDRDRHAKYRQETVDIAQAALDSIKSSNLKNPQFDWAKDTLLKYLSEAHFFLYLEYKSKNEAAKAKEHLKQAEATTTEPKLKTMYKDLLEKEK